MRIKPLESGSRSLTLDTAYLKLDIVVHPDGTITINEAKCLEPRKVVNLDIIQRRSDICSNCDRCEGVTIRDGKFPVYSVKCKSCGCGGLSLQNGKCPKGYWDEQV